MSFALLSFVGGAVSGHYYATNGGKNWIKTMALTAAFLPVVIFGLGFLLNFIAIGKRSLSSIPFSTMIVLVLIWSFIDLPLTLLGTILGKNWKGFTKPPCRISSLPRPIPEKKWFTELGLIIPMGGILPFASIFIEMYFILTSFWNYRYYYVYGFMLLVTVILVIVTICVTIVSTYFLLNTEDYRWQWASFTSAASTAFYVYMYSIYYFFWKTKMTGFFQTTFYFGYMFMFCFTFAILCGTVGFIGTRVFIYQIYQSVKID